MNRSGMSLAFPPFTRMVKRLVIINTAIFVFMLLARNFFPAGAALMQLGWLVPREVLHGRIWELVDLFLLSRRAVSTCCSTCSRCGCSARSSRSDWGSSRFLEFFFFCVVGAALTTIVLGYMGSVFFGPVVRWRIRLRWDSSAKLASLVYTPTVGASGGIYGLLIAFGMLYGDRQIFMFPFPFAIRAKYMIGIWIFLAMVGALAGRRRGGQLRSSGRRVLRLVLSPLYTSQRGLQLAASEGYFGFRNRYYRWKRRRAARKFEVYMRSQGQTGESLRTARSTSTNSATSRRRTIAARKVIRAEARALPG